MRVLRRLTARTQSGAEWPHPTQLGRPKPHRRTRGGFFRAVLRTRDKPGNLTVPRTQPERRSGGTEGKRKSRGAGGRGNERVASPPSLTPEWFAPDILIGFSLPFELRAARVARQRLSFGVEEPGLRSPSLPLTCSVVSGSLGSRFRLSG